MKWSVTLNYTPIRTDTLTCAHEAYDAELHLRGPKARVAPRPHIASPLPDGGRRKLTPNRNCTQHISDIAILFSMSQPALFAQPFEYHGVELAPGRWQRQMAAARDFYLHLPDDDILYGFRKAAGLPAPGAALGGWCGEDSSPVFGQWLSGMARLSRALNDDALRNKAIALFEGWAATLRPGGSMSAYEEQAKAVTADTATNAVLWAHYTFDKLVGGLVDLAQFAGHAPALPVLERVVAQAMRTFDRSNRAADPESTSAYQGAPVEWYTLSEHLFRAYVFTGVDSYRAHALQWLYPEYWSRFAANDLPAHAHGVHAYSHVNTFSSAMMAYAVLGDPQFLRVAQNAASYVRSHQMFATGGYGPNERFVAPEIGLGRALDTRSDTCEVSCCSWAGFKLARYLLQYTGEAHYGDWIEQLLYNAIGAALPIAEGGRAFYYGDYRVGGGMKVYNWETFTCCSGTYLQNVAEYHNLVYFHDARGLFVNLYLPSTVTWQHSDAAVAVRQETAYPDDGHVRFTISVNAPTTLALHFRVPGWSSNVALSVNGEATSTPAAPGSWATIERVWKDGDRIDLEIPLLFRLSPADPHMPDRVALMRGPVVFVLEGAYHDTAFRLPNDDAALAAWLQPEPGGRPRGIHGAYTPQADPPTIFSVIPPDGPPARLRFRPFYEIGEGYPYFMYFDRNAPLQRLW